MGFYYGIPGSDNDEDYNSVNDEDYNPRSDNDIITGHVSEQVQEIHDIYAICNNDSSCRCLPIKNIINNIMTESKGDSSFIFYYDAPYEF